MRTIILTRGFSFISQTKVLRYLLLLIKNYSQSDTFEPSPNRKIFFIPDSSLISELLAIMLFLIFVSEFILQFCIMIEFSMLDTEIVVLSPTLTFGPIEEPVEI